MFELDKFTMIRKILTLLPIPDSNLKLLFLSKKTFKLLLD